MLRRHWWLVLFLFEANAVLLCYNCSATHREWNHCAGAFAQSVIPFNDSQRNLVNCSGENAMCFVRSWTARARHAWIVQRGCYESNARDMLIKSVNIPTRSMSCKHERYPEAEYKVCLCQANWCNSVSRAVPSVIQYLTMLPMYTIRHLLQLDTYKV